MERTMPSALDRLIAEASVLAGCEHPCAVLGHVWIFSSGAACGCPGGACSLPVYECQACGDFDYGNNDESAEIIAECEYRMEATA